MNLTGWMHAQGVHATTAYLWYREGKLPIAARKVGRLILVSPNTAAALHQKVGLDRQAARLSAWTGHRPACPWSGGG